MKYGKVWKAIITAYIIGALILAGGILKGGLEGSILTVAGIVVLVATTVRSGILGTMLCAMMGGATVYFLQGRNTVIYGVLIGVVLGGGIVWLLGGWVKETRDAIDTIYRKVQLALVRNQRTALYIMKDIDSMIKGGSYITRGSTGRMGTYREELQYLKQQFKNIEYEKKDLDSLEEAAASYGDVLEELNRLGRQLNPSYTSSTMWSIDYQRYR